MTMLARVHEYALLGEADQIARNTARVIGAALLLR
jgi:hypothetical protein